MSLAGKNKAVIALELRENLCTQVPGARFSVQVQGFSQYRTRPHCLEGLFTLGARAPVPGYRHKMVLCSHLRVPDKWLCTLFSPFRPVIFHFETWT